VIGRKTKQEEEQKENKEAPKRKRVMLRKKKKSVKERKTNRSEMKMMFARINYIIEIETTKKTWKNKETNQDRNLRL